LPLAISRVAATVLGDPAPHIGRVYELTGPRSVDMTELAAAFSRALDRPVSYVDTRLDCWPAGLARLGLPPHTQQHVATMAQLHRDNRYERTADSVERVTGTPAQSIEAFVAARSWPRAAQYSIITGIRISFSLRSRRPY
jgi:uncharacterized protein YbjT (DUF2867 family)